MKTPSTNQFVTQDPSHLGELEQVTRVTDGLLSTLDDAAGRLENTNENVANAIRGISDFLQSFVYENCGVDVQQVSEETDTSAATLTACLSALGRLTQNSGQEISDRTADAEHQLRNRLQTVTTGIHLYRDEVDANGLTERSSSVFAEVCAELTAMSSALNESKEKQPPRLGRRQVILVEDNSRERKMLMNMLNDHGFDVRDFSDGEKALNYIFTERPHATVLLDMKMPGCDGPTAIRRIRADKSLCDMPIIGVSASASADCDIHDDDAGVTGWFRKPFDPNALIDILETESIATATLPAKRIA